MKNRTTNFPETASVEFTNETGSAISSGAVVKLGHRFGVAQADIANNEIGALQLKGRFLLPKATGVSYTQGQKVGWDAGNVRVTALLIAGVLGVVAAAAGNDDVEVEVELDGDQNDFPPVASIVAASTAVTATSDPTKFNLQHTIPANTLKAGDVVRIRAQVIATATNSTDTLALKAFLGTTEVAAVAAVDVANGDIGVIDLDVVIRTIGAGGTCVAAGAGSIGTPGTATMKPIFKASQAINTAAALAAAIEATWSTNNAGNSCRLDVLNVQVLRQAG